jgi:hypothetical protein
MRQTAAVAVAVATRSRARVRVQLVDNLMSSGGRLLGLLQASLLTVRVQVPAVRVHTARWHYTWNLVLVLVLESTMRRTEAINVSPFLCVHACVCECVSVWVCVRVCACVCVCLGEGVVYT